MLVPLSRNPFPPGEKIVSRGKEYICQRCNAQEKSADVRGPKLESKFRNLTRLKCLTWGNLQHSPVHTMQNFVCFAKKSLNRKQFLVRMIFFAHQNFKVRWQNPLLLDSYPSLGHLILWTLPMNYFSFNWCFWSHKKFHVCVLSADKVSQKEKNWLSTKNFQTLCKHQTISFVTVWTGPMQAVSSPLFRSHPIFVLGQC